jgi:hypothetical protein
MSGGPGIDSLTRTFRKIPCPLCESTNPEGAPCVRCFAPAEVIHSILSRKKAPRFIGVLGPSGVGKTVYLGMLLDLLSRGAGGMHGVARGTFSLALHRNLVLALERQRFPAKTPNEADRWQWVHCEINNGKRGAFDVVTPDVAGEAVASELSNPGTNATVQVLIRKCSGLVVLVDLPQVVASGQGQELFAMQLVSYLSTFKTIFRRRRKVETPIAFVFTKTDLCDDPIDDPAAFARDNVPGLWRLCEFSLQTYQFFTSAVAGSAAMVIDGEGQESMIPLRVEPHGVIEPFAWLVSKCR